MIGRGRFEEGLRRDGNRFPMHLAVDDISDSLGVRFVGVIRALTAERERDALCERALHDPMTALPNRVYARQRLQLACDAAIAQGPRFALLYVDLDRVKTVNDTLGHPAGDAVLVAIAQRLRLTLAACDFVTRLGGDEFLALLIGVDTDAQAQSVAARLSAPLQPPVVVESRRVSVDASIGAALWGADGRAADELLAAADQAMYRAKRAARAATREVRDA